MGLDQIADFLEQLRDRTPSEAATPAANASKTADVDAVVAETVGLRLVGFTARESDGTPAAAAFDIVHGVTADGGTGIIPVELSANESTSDWFWPGIAVASGLSLNHVAGTWDCTLFYITVT